MQNKLFQINSYEKIIFGEKDLQSFSKVIMLAHCWCQEHKWKIFSPSIILMINLDHSLVHVLYKQEKNLTLCKCKDT